MSVAEATRANQINRLVWQRNIAKVLITIALLVVTAAIIIPFIWMIAMSLRTSANIFANPLWLSLGISLAELRRPLLQSADSIPPILF